MRSLPCELDLQSFVVIMCPFISWLEDLFVSSASQVPYYIISLVSSLIIIMSCQDNNTCRWNLLMTRRKQSQNIIFYRVSYVVH